jgi:hypothetical protein
MSSRVETGRRGRLSPSTRKIRTLGGAKKSWILEIHHSGDSRREIIRGSEAGKLSPSPRLGPEVEHGARPTNAYAATAADSKDR